jgi:hypothetical protein
LIPVHLRRVVCSILANFRVPFSILAHSPSAIAIVLFVVNFLIISSQSGTVRLKHAQKLQRSALGLFSPHSAADGGPFQSRVFLLIHRTPRLLLILSVFSGISDSQI